LLFSPIPLTRSLKAAVWLSPSVMACKLMVVGT
jgi:hypothetical protein